MKAVKLYMTLDEFDMHIKKRVSEEERNQLKESMFVPVKIGINESDMSIEVLAVTTTK